MFYNYWFIVQIFCLVFASLWRVTIKCSLAREGPSWKGAGEVREIANSSHQIDARPQTSNKERSESLIGGVSRHFRPIREDATAHHFSEHAVFQSPWAVGSSSEEKELVRVELNKISQDVSTLLDEPFSNGIDDTDVKDVLKTLHNLIEKFSKDLKGPRGSSIHFAAELIPHLETLFSRCVKSRSSDCTKFGRMPLKLLDWLLRFNLCSIHPSVFPSFFSSGFLGALAKYIAYKLSPENHAEILLQGARIKDVILRQPMFEESRNLLRSLRDENWEGIEFKVLQDLQSHLLSSQARELPPAKYFNRSHKGSGKMSEILSDVQSRTMKSREFSQLFNDRMRCNELLYPFHQAFLHKIYLYAEDHRRFAMIDERLRQQMAYYGQFYDVFAALRQFYHLLIMPGYVYQAHGLPEDEKTLITYIDRSLPNPRRNLDGESIRGTASPYREGAELVVRVKGEDQMKRWREELRSAYRKTITRAVGYVGFLNEFESSSEQMTRPFRERLLSSSLPTDPWTYTYQSPPAVLQAMCTLTRLYFELHRKLFVGRLSLNMEGESMYSITRHQNGSWTFLSIPGTEAEVLGREPKWKVLEEPFRGDLKIEDEEKVISNTN